MKQRLRLVQRQAPRPRQRFRLHLRTIHIYVIGGFISITSISVLLLSNISSPRDSMASVGDSVYDRQGMVSYNTEDLKYDDFKLLSNSFSESISARYSSDKRQEISLKLVTMQGSVVLFENFNVKQGDNFLRCDVPASIPKQTYILFVENKDSVLATSIVACSQ